MATDDVLLEATEVSYKKATEELDVRIVDYTNKMQASSLASDALIEQQNLVFQIKTVLSVLKGEPPPRPIADPRLTGDDEERPATNQLLEPAPEPKPKKKKDRGDPDNPYNSIQCNGCGSKGTLNEQMKSAGGKVVRMLICRKCSNQSVL